MRRLNYIELTLPLPVGNPACLATSAQAFFFLFLSLKSLRDLLYRTGKRHTASATFSSMGLDAMFSRETREGFGALHCDWFILPLLLPTLTIWFSLGHERNVSVGVASGVGRKWNRSDSSDSDSVALMTPLATPTFDFH